MIEAIETTSFSPAAVRWLRTWSEEHATTFRVGRCGARVVAEWVGVARLSADIDGTSPKFEVVRGADPDWVSKLRNGPVNALLRHLTGGISFHASAVVLPEGGVLFLGESGAGKSTMAADLCTHEGGALLGDDTVSVSVVADGVRVCPTEALAWLRSQSSVRYGLVPVGGSKTLFRPGAVAAAPVPLRAIFKLSFDETGGECQKRRLPGSEAFEILSGSLFRFLLDDPEALVRDFDALQQLIAKVSVYELKRPPSFDALCAVRGIVRSSASESA